MFWINYISFFLAKLVFGIRCFIWFCLICGHYDESVTLQSLLPPRLHECTVNPCIIQLLPTQSVDVTINFPSLSLFSSWLRRNSLQVVNRGRKLLVKVDVFLEWSEPCRQYLRYSIKCPLSFGDAQLFKRLECLSLEVLAPESCETNQKCSWLI